MQKAPILYLIISLVLCAVMGKYAYDSGYKMRGGIAYSNESIQKLLKYNVVTADELNDNGNITVREALEKLDFLQKDFVMSVYQYEYWYKDGQLKEYDHLDYKTKSFILGLYLNRLINIEEVSDLDFDADLTNYQAVVYVTRYIADNYSCLMGSDELDFTEPSQTYEAAYKKKLINKTAPLYADKPISRKNFYILMAKAYDISFCPGGDPPVRRSMFERLDIINGSK